MAERKRRGRPPTNPDNPTGVGSYHLGLRFSDAHREQLLRIVEVANERAKANGLPGTITPSGLVAHWIRERIDEETAKLGKKR